MQNVLALAVLRQSGHRDVDSVIGARLHLLLPSQEARRLFGIGSGMRGSIGPRPISALAMSPASSSGLSALKKDPKGGGEAREGAGGAVPLRLRGLLKGAPGRGDLGRPQDAAADYEGCEAWGSHGPGPLLDDPGEDHASRMVF